MQSTPSGPTPQHQVRGNRRKRHPPLSANSSGRSFGTALWEQKLQKKALKQSLLKELNKELQEDVFDSLRKIKEELEAENWFYEISSEGIDF